MSRQSLDRKRTESVNFRRGVSGWVACYCCCLQAVAVSSVFDSSQSDPVLDRNNV